MKIPNTLGWFGFSLAIIAIVPFAAWSTGRIYDSVAAGNGGIILFVTFLVLLVAGVVLLSSSKALKQLSGKNKDNQK